LSALTACEKITARVAVNHIIMFIVGGHQCIQFLAHLLGGFRILRQQITAIHTCKKFNLEWPTQVVIVLVSANLCELVQHVSECSICFSCGLHEKTQTADTATLRRTVFLRLELEHGHCLI
jgi:hypothetical protein